MIFLPDDGGTDNVQMVHPQIDVLFRGDAEFRFLVLLSDDLGKADQSFSRVRLALFGESGAQSFCAICCANQPHPPAQNA
jgi:hypothetical protein